MMKSKLTFAVVNCTESQLPDINRDRNDVERDGSYQVLSYQTTIKLVVFKESSHYKCFDSSNSQKKMSNDHTAATNAKPSAKSFNDLMSRSTQSLRSPVSGTRLGPAPRFPTPVNVSHQPLFFHFSKVFSALPFVNLFREEVCIATNPSPTTQTCCHLGRAKPFR